MVTDTTTLAPPFPATYPGVDGIHGLDAFTSGTTSTWQVQALRVKSGALGFVLKDQGNGNPPEIYPRYEHPSGIMLRSRWSEERDFTAE